MTSFTRENGSHRQAKQVCLLSSSLSASSRITRLSVEEYKEGVVPACLYSSHLSYFNHVQQQQRYQRSAFVRGTLAVDDFVLMFPPLYYSKATGQYHSLKGTVVETVGDMTGAKSWSDSGKQEHAAGETEYKAAQAKGYAEGLKDNITGKKDTVVGALTGDRQQETAGALSSSHM